MSQTHAYQRMDEIGLATAIQQAVKSQQEGGLPIGSSLLRNETVLSLGHNRREQDKDAVAHAEIDCLRRGGLLRGDDYASCTLYSTLSPCWMCAGATRLYGIKRVVIADDGNNVPGVEVWRASHDFFTAAGIELISLQDEDMIERFRNFLRDSPSLWAGDVGLTDSN